MDGTTFARFLRLVAAVVPLALCAARPAAAQTNDQPAGDKIVIEYYEPRSPVLTPLYEKLRARGVLEELRLFLSPAPWPRTLRLIMKECPPSRALTPQVYYSKIDFSVTICYQWVRFLGQLHPDPHVGTPREAIAGALAGIVLRESARAMFDMFDAPILGSEDDAADEAAAFVSVQFGDEVAHALVVGSYLIWQKYAVTAEQRRSEGGLYDFSTPSSLPYQHMYNVLCIAYGSGSPAIKELVERGDLALPPERAQHCADEYQQAKRAFAQTIAARADPAKLKEVQGMSWLTPEDVK